jgi:hypothetical protein
VLSNGAAVADNRILTEKLLKITAQQENQSEIKKEIK